MTAARASELVRVGPETSDDLVRDSTVFLFVFSSGD